MDRTRTLGALRQALATLDPLPGDRRHGLVALGADPVDAVLGGGLARGAVHEIYPAHAADMAAAAGFALGVFLRIADAGPLLWIRQGRAAAETGRVHGHGVSEMGVDAGALILVTVPDAASVLGAAREALACRALGAAIVESWGDSPLFDLKASRMLLLAAQQSGTMGLLVRSGAQPVPSAAATRWLIRAAPSFDPLGLPGHPALAVELLRHRGGAPGARWSLEWNHEHRRFALPPLSRPVPAPVLDRPAAPDKRQGWARAG